MTCSLQRTWTIIDLRRRWFLEASHRHTTATTLKCKITMELMPNTATLRFPEAPAALRPRLFGGSPVKRNKEVFPGRLRAPLIGLNRSGLRVVVSLALDQSIMSECMLAIITRQMHSLLRPGVEPTAWTYVGCLAGAYLCRPPYSLRVASQLGPLQSYCFL